MGCILLYVGVCSYRRLCTVPSVSGDFILVFKCQRSAEVMEWVLCAYLAEIPLRYHSLLGPAGVMG